MFFKVHMAYLFIELLGNSTKINAGSEGKSQRLAERKLLLIKIKGADKGSQSKVALRVRKRRGRA
jgi:hypothetical protein